MEEREYGDPCARDAMSFAGAADRAAILGLIRGRRSPAVLDPEGPVRPDAVWEALGCAVTAPNHHATHPWRFTVVTGDERDRVGRAFAEEQVREGHVPPARLQLEAAKMCRAPVVIVAHFRAAEDPTVRLEDTLAVGAAIQNLVLAVHAQGLAVLWRTGRMAGSAAFRAAVGLDADEVIAGILHIGRPRPDVPLPPRKEIAAAAVTRMLDGGADLPSAPG